jgi:hypothetical protein
MGLPQRHVTPLPKLIYLGNIRQGMPVLRTDPQGGGPRGIVGANQPPCTDYGRCTAEGYRGHRARG